MKTRLLLILIFLCNIIYAQWQQLGPTQFSSFAKDADIAVDSNNGDTYVGYIDILDNNLIKVMKYDGTTWANYGTTATSIGSDLFTLEINPVTNQPWIAYKNINNLDVIRFDGANWVLETSISTTPAGKIQIKFDASGNAIVLSSTNMTGSGTIIMNSNYSGSWVSEYTFSGVVGIPDLISPNLIRCVMTNGAFYTRTLSYSGTSWSVSDGNTLENSVFSGTTGMVAIDTTHELFFNSTSIIEPTSTVAYNSIVSNNSSLLNAVEYTYSTVDGRSYFFYVNSNNDVVLLRDLDVEVQSPYISLSSLTNAFVRAKYDEITGSIYVVYNDGEKCSVKKYTVAAPLAKYYVNANVSGGNGTGDSWANALSDLQGALLSSNNSTNEIWIAAGTYVPGTSGSATFNLNIDNLNVYGGFNGTESSLADRDILANPTILSGDVNGNDGVLVSNHFDNAARYDNSNHVVTVNANGILIDGVKIEDGYASQTSGVDSHGSSILVEETAENFILKNSEINNNFSINGGSVRAYLNVDTQMTIENCKFNNNHSRYASGLYFLVNNNKTVTLNLINTLFTNNSTLNIYSTNTGFTGSGAWIRAAGSGSNLTTNIVNCTFANNSDIGTASSSERGALGLGRRTDGTSTHNAEISNSIFYNNTGASQATTFAISKGHVLSPNQTVVYNSIDEASFSNLTFLSNTSNADPLFTDSANNDFTLQTGSPAIDSGDNSKIPSGVTMDLLFKDRIHNTNVDMGPYEFVASSLSTIDVLNDNAFIVYPNPAKSFLNIKMNLDFEKAEIFNLQGQKILESSSERIDISKLSNNIYLLKVESVTGKIATRRIIKK